MGNFVNLYDFEDFIGHDLICEALDRGHQIELNKTFLKGGPIIFADGSSVTPQEIVNAVNKALEYLASEYYRTFKFGNRLNIIYLAHSKIYKTMAVDKYMNLYMNAGFIYHTLKMDKELIAAVIMHEVLHALFNHIERGKNWLMAKGKPINDKNWMDINLASDLEVNKTLVKIGIIDEDRLVNEIHGIYLKSSYGLKKDGVNVVMMETILENEEYMNALRGGKPKTPDPETKPKDEIKTSEDWNKGYKDAWNKVASIVKKYGYKKAWEMFEEAGIVNSVGEINTKKTKDLMTLEFMVKSFSEYVLESNTPDIGKTYDDGFETALEKVLEKIYVAINGAGGEGGGQGTDTDMPKYNTGISNDELDEIELPETESGDEQDGDDDGLPENIKNSGSSKNKSNDGDDPSGDGKNTDGENESGDDENDGDGGDDQDGNDDRDRSGSKKNGYGKGGKGKSDDQLTDSDYTQLEDDLEKKAESGETINGSSEILNGDDNSIGGTGSFTNEEIGDDVLKDSGYDEESIEKIKEIREYNKEHNSPAAIEKARKEMRNSTNKYGAISKILNDIEIESSKYKNLWKEIMEKFLANKTRRAGNKINDRSIDWKRKSRIALGEVGPQYKKVDQDPQDLNVYVDVSGSVDVELLEIISRSLLEFTKSYKYSGINICPWASTSNGVYPVDCMKNSNEDEIVKDILEIVSRGISQCGGGTDGNAAIAAMVDVVVMTLNSEKKKKKDDVHVVITDGYFDFSGIENRITGALKSEIERTDVAETAPENTFWMIYDANESLVESWKKEIKKGKLIFINSEIVKNNR